MCKGNHVLDELRIIRIEQAIKKLLQQNQSLKERSEKIEVRLNELQRQMSDAVDRRDNTSPVATVVSE